MAMNTPRILGGGLAAGLVINGFDFLMNVILKDQMGAAMNAAAPGLADKAMTTTAMVQFVVLDFALGIMLVWLYAAIRPRFGPGPRTAVIAGVVQWLFGGLFYWVWVIFGLMTPTTFAMASVFQLVSMMVAANVGAMIYKEEAAAA